MAGLEDIFEAIADIAELFGDSGRKRPGTIPSSEHRLPPQKSTAPKQKRMIPPEDRIPQEDKRTVKAAQEPAAERNAQSENTTPSKPKEKLVPRLDTSAAGMRNALIMSELISPPLALRGRRFR